MESFFGLSFNDPYRYGRATSKPILSCGSMDIQSTPLPHKQKGPRLSGSSSQHRPATNSSSQPTHEPTKRGRFWRHSPVPPAFKESVLPLRPRTYVNRHQRSSMPSPNPAPTLSPPLPSRSRPKSASDDQMLHPESLTQFRATGEETSLRTAEVSQL